MVCQRGDRRDGAHGALCAQRGWEEEEEEVVEYKIGPVELPVRSGEAHGRVVESTQRKNDGGYNMVALAEARLTASIHM